MPEDVEKTPEDVEETQEEEQEKINPTVSIEDAGPCKKKIKVEVPAEKVAAEIDKTYKDLLKDMEVPGFRKGHVPRSVAERRFGERVSEEVQSGLISRALGEIMEEQKLEPIGEPAIDDIKFDPKEPLTYVATINLQPDVKFDDYKGISLERKVSAVTDEDIEKQIDLLRRRGATHTPVERGAKAGDLASMDFTIECDGKGLRDIKDAQLIIHGESLFGLNVGPLEKLLGGKKNGETAEATAVLPDNFREEEYRGKDAVLKITVKEIKEEQLPEVNDEWAKSLDYDNLDELREETGKNLKKHNEGLADIGLHNQVRDYLVEKADFELPEDLVKTQVEAYFRRKRLDMEEGGMEPAQIEQELQKLRKTEDKTEEDARKMLKGYFMFKHIADKEKVYVTEEEIARQIAGIAARYGRSPQEMAALYEKTGLIGELRVDMREKKTIDFIIKNAEVKEAK